MYKDSDPEDQEQMKSEAKERRKTQRIEVKNIPVEIFDADGLTILGVGQIANLGINCAGLYSTINFAVNTNFAIRFILEGRYVLNIYATVARVVEKERKKYYGIRFNKVDFLQEENLKEFLEKKLLENKTS
ncbi:MAG: PilZ domain-containing protein [Elusimicrobia bacterium]|nr:PilZ domain-containing protein [Candidatus Liberimonas magnetica]